jgi:hypothetical protein
MLIRLNNIQYKQIKISNSNDKGIIMKNYKIYTDSKGNTNSVKMGWSWSAFFFTWIWALGKKLWTVSTFTTGVLLMTCAIAFFAVAITPEMALQLSSNLLFIYSGYFVLGFSILMGLKGNQWYENKLLTRNHRFQAIITADSSEEAIAFFINKDTAKHLLAA